MIHLAARETCGRNRFQRKLLLAEICLNSKRERLARSILEELAEQIDNLKLELWESSELVGGVWIRLYKLYNQGTDSSDLDRAAKLYRAPLPTGSVAGPDLRRGINHAGRPTSGRVSRCPSWIA